MIHYIWVSLVANVVMLVGGALLVYWLRGERFVLGLHRERIERRAREVVDLIDSAKSQMLGEQLAAKEAERRIVALSEANVRLQEERDRIQQIHDRYKTEAANAQELLLRAVGKVRRKYLAACEAAKLEPEPPPRELVLVEAGFVQEATGQDADQAMASALDLISGGRSAPPAAS